MNRKIEVTSKKNKREKNQFRYKLLIVFIMAVIIVSFIIYMLQTSVNDIIWL